MWVALIEASWLHFIQPRFKHECKNVNFFFFLFWSQQPRERTPNCPAPEILLKGPACQVEEDQGLSKSWLCVWPGTLVPLVLK